MENRCVMCGVIIPEGLLVCPICTKKALTEERRKKTMSINWKRKLTSRKFWAAVADFVSMLLIALRVDEGSATQVVALIMAGAGVVAYIIGEGITDAAATQWEDVQEDEMKPPEDEQ